MNFFSFTRASRDKKKSTFREYTEAVVVAVLLALFIRAFVVQAFKIPSGSMKNTLLIGDHILVSKFSYGLKIPVLDKEIIHLGSPQRGDIVVFKYPQDPSKDFIKRVIGLPGDTIVIRNKKVFVNGQPLKEPYARFTDPRILPGAVSPRDNLGPLVVPPHSFFVMGDNRDESYDSRFWKFVDESDLKGKAFIIYWSWNKEGELTLDPARCYVRWNRIGHLLH
ncbi:signal peptidase I Serine peptidase. MEROPS family S26A [Desulfacinum hydrothermale DSM 13146]|uniref:Signal peptidase I n=1 Tax=Desulfacinum hydrothermale DSM 13146 TaxID=1121390 RepID=A0A1W1X284_9BACT|nr:signal peptidase I [Desulfacinum hydrothermale]SMC17933.1 signal peptidase I Serine peptidase. MEROPS family S26A [Desulfacinum hydrothermale DSM 13146]